MEQYSNMALVYDKLMEDVDYANWVDYLTKLMDNLGFQEGGILELGCGTGNITVEMAKRGYDISGLDISSSMLAVAQQKVLSNNLQVIFFNQSMEQLNLNAKYQCILCPCDGFNYLTSRTKLSTTIKRIKKHLTPDGILIFDISSPYKLSTILGDNTFTRVEEDICYIWENSYSQRDKKLEMFITFFEKQENCYIRFEEHHMQRAHTIEEIKGILMEAGFETIKIYGNFSGRRPKEKDERIHFACRLK